ncbi:Hypothetical predicted protein [Paramuricea clavata]|uniref:Uncharacterized protein n=1 Tax=Paramuricea clavata TaxID=317549 RepID=A0A7D9J7U7_PARCT|nr:Hypothetical predicted protein [Paramuricea clavata]
MKKIISKREREDNGNDVVLYLTEKAEMEKGMRGKVFELKKAEQEVERSRLESKLSRLKIIILEHQSNLFKSLIEQQQQNQQQSQAIQMMLLQQQQQQTQAFMAMLEKLTK